VPGEIGGFTRERLLRAPRAGLFSSDHRIGDRVSAGETIGHVADAPACAEIDGVLRGLLCSGLEVTKGFKIGDIDPRATREHCFLVSDKARAIGGGVLEAACMFLGGVRFDVAAIRNAGHGRRRFE
jgi:xanthine dehydrogenase accessory factor